MIQMKAAAVATALSSLTVRISCSAVWARLDKACHQFSGVALGSSPQPVVVSGGGAKRGWTGWNRFTTAPSSVGRNRASKDGTRSVGTKLILMY